MGDFHIDKLDELSFDINGQEHIADVAAYEKRAIDYIHDVIRTQELPLMVAEILSPTQTIAELTTKAELYLQEGIQSCWLVIPPAQTIMVFNQGQKPQSFSTGNLNDPVLTIEIPIEEIF